jgi:hypothetical protein
VAAVTLFDATDAEPGPTELVAVTVKVYAVPCVKPLVMVHDVVEVVHVPPAGADVTV